MSTEQIVKTSADVAAATTLFGTWLQLLPPIAALFAMVYYAVVLVEKATGKTLHELLLEYRNRHEDTT